MTTPRAVTQLMTWFDSVGIEFRSVGHELLVVNAEGREVLVSVVVKGSPVSDGALVVNGSDLTNRSLKVSLEAFAALQQTLGFEAKMPVDRGAIPTHKLANNADFDLAAMRHTEFRRSPNPSADLFKRYDSTITRACWRFFRMNQVICADNMFGIDDLKSYAMVWMTNFTGLHALRLTTDTSNQNERLLYTYLTQRFEEFRKLLISKSRNELPMLDDAFIGQHGRPYDYSNRSSWDTTSAHEHPEEEAEDLFVDTSTPDGRKLVNARRSAANQELDDRFAGMEHDKLVAILTAAIENDRIHPDARAEANRRLQSHVHSCESCAALASLPVEGEEPVAGADTTSAAE